MVLSQRLASCRQKGESFHLEKVTSGQQETHLFIHTVGFSVAVGTLKTKESGHVRMCDEMSTKLTNLVSPDKHFKFCCCAKAINVNRH